MIPKYSSHHEPNSTAASQSVEGVLSYLSARAYAALKKAVASAQRQPLLNIDMLMMNITGDKGWLLPLETRTMAPQSGPDTFTTQHVSAVSCPDNKGPQLSVHLNGRTPFCCGVRGRGWVALGFGRLCPSGMYRRLRQ